MNFVHLKQFLGIEMISGVLKNALLVTVWKTDSQDSTILIDLKIQVTAIDTFFRVCSF